MWRWIVGGLVIVVISGCSPETLESAKKDIDRDTKVVKQGAEQFQRTAKPVLDAAKPVTDVVKKEADKRVEQLKVGARVTAALKANENLPQSIRVDAAPDAQRISLRGTVKTAKQKALAEKIARQTIGSDRRVENDLQVEAE